MARFTCQNAIDLTINLLISNAKRIYPGTLLMVFLMLVNVNTVASQEVRNLDEYLASLKAAKSPALEADGERLFSLVYDLHPVLFLVHGELSNPLGGTPVCLTTDIASMHQLYQPNAMFHSVELVTILLEEAESAMAKLELDKLQSFTNLRHIYFMSKSELCATPDPDCEAQKIAHIISGLESPEIQVLYKVVTSN